MLLRAFVFSSQVHGVNLRLLLIFLVFSLDLLPAKERSPFVHIKLQKIRSIEQNLALI
jgi:hypothetical protein